MGPCTSKKQDAASNAARRQQEKDVQEKIGARLKVGLTHVQVNLAGQLKDPEMMRKILDIVMSLVQAKVPETGTQMFFKYSLMGHHLEYTESYKYSKRFAQAVGTLLESDRLAQVQLSEKKNPLSPDWLFTEIEKAADRQTQKAEDGEEAPGEHFFPTGGRAKYNAAKSGTGKQQDESEASVYSEDRAKMLAFIEPFFDLVRFLPDGIQTKLGMTELEKNDLQFRIGAAAMTIKIYEPSKNAKLKRAAFVGPESIGKSTLINHLTSSGRGDTFMPEASGMGTQTICIISHSPHEKLAIGGRDLPRTSSVQQQLEAEITKVKQGKSGIKALEAYRASKPFYPPFDVELIDVPGIKNDKQLDSSLALGVSSVLCICLGPLDMAKSQFGTPGTSLALLVPLLDALPNKLPILCLVTREVTQSQFRAQDYVKMLKDVFGASTNVKAVWANFKEMTIEQARTTCASVFREIDRYPHMEANPYKLFMQLEPKATVFLNNVWRELKDAMQVKYIAKFDNLMDNVIPGQVGFVSNRNDLKFISTMLGKNRVEKALEVKQNTMPVFSALAQERTLAVVPDEVYIAQELLHEVRLGIVQWLTDQGNRLHDITVGDSFLGIQHLIVPRSQDSSNDSAKACAQEITCTKFVESVRGQKHKDVAILTTDEDQMNKMDISWWHIATVNKLGKFMGYSAFPWIITGYYLIAVDSYNKSEMLGRFLQEEEGKLNKIREFFGDNTAANWTDEWNKRVIKTLKKTPYIEWAQRCQKCTGKPLEQFTEIFKCMQDAGNMIGTMVDDMKLISNWNPLLNELTEVCFVMTQRLMVKKPVKDNQYGLNLKFTSFADHLIFNAKAVSELESVQSLLINAEPSQIETLCGQAVSMMKSSKSGTAPMWAETIFDLEETVESMAALTPGTGKSDFASGGERQVMFVSGVFGKSVADPGISSEGLVLDLGSSTGCPQWEVLLDSGWTAMGDEITEILNAVEAKNGLYSETYIYTCRAETREVVQAEAEHLRDDSSMRGFVYHMKLGVTQTNMKTYKGRPMRKVDTGTGSTPTTASLRMVRGADEDLPKYIAGALGKMREKYDVYQPEGDSPSEFAYADNTLAEIRRRGTSVVVCMRPKDFTTDAVFYEPAMLKRMSGEPHISDCFIIWDAPASVVGWPSPGTLAKWEKQAGNMKIHLMPITNPEQVSNFLSDLSTALADSKVLVRERINVMVNELIHKKKVIQTELGKYLESRTEHSENKPDWFHQHLCNEVRAVLKEASIEFEQSAEDSDPFVLPTATWMKNQPTLLVRSAETNLGKGDTARSQDAYSINELQARVLLTNIFLGQVMESASKLAEKAYDRVLMRVFDKIGEWFAMDGKAFLQELDAFTQGNKEKIKDREDLIRDLVVKDHFVLMYVGCVLWSVVPLVYSVLLPLLWDQTAGTKSGAVTSKVYEKNIERAIIILSATGPANLSSPNAQQTVKKGRDRHVM